MIVIVKDRQIVMFVSMCYLPTSGQCWSIRPLPSTGGHGRHPCIRICPPPAPGRHPQRRMLGIQLRARTTSHIRLADSQGLSAGILGAYCCTTLFQISPSRLRCAVFRGLPYIPSYMGSYL